MQVGRWCMYVCVADVAIGPRELSTAPVEWFQTWSSACVQTLMLFPYPVHALQASGEGSVCGKCEIQSHRAIRCSSTMTQRSTYANVQTLALFPYPEHALQTSGEAVYVADVGGPISSCSITNSKIKLYESTNPSAVPIPCACIADKWGGSVCGRCGSQHPRALCSPSGVNLCPCQARQGGPRTCSEAAWRCCLCWYVPLFFHSHLHFFLMYVFFVQFLRGGVLSLDTRAAF